MTWKNNKVYGLNTVMNYGKHKGKTMKEIMDDFEAGAYSLCWYVDNHDLKLDAEAYDYMLEGIEMRFINMS